MNLSGNTDKCLQYKIEYDKMIVCKYGDLLPKIVFATFFAF